MSTIKELRKEIDERWAKIKRIQDDCSHPVDCVTKINKGDTGNWCPQDDSYWRECHCSLCDKRWTEDQ